MTTKPVLTHMLFFCRSSYLSLDSLMTLRVEPDTAYHGDSVAELPMVIASLGVTCVRDCLCLSLSFSGSSGHETSQTSTKLNFRPGFDGHVVTDSPVELFEICSLLLIDRYGQLHSIAFK